MKNDKEEFIRTAREQFELDCEQEREIREEARIDLDFRSGNQWDERMKASRKAEGRPALTFDKTHVYIQSVANEARQNKPQCKVAPLGGGATEDVATVINGILRHVGYRSQADRAWDTGLDYSAGSSFGYVRVVTEFLPKSMDQEIRILPVLDPFQIYGVLIPACRGEKARHMFVVSRMPREDYKEKFGTEDEPVDFESGEWKACGDWIDDKTVRIAEYWRVESETKTLRFIQQSDGTPRPIYTDEQGFSESLRFVMDPDHPDKVWERDEEVDTVCFCKIDGTRVLPGTETEWAGDSIPCVAVLGQQLIKDGDIQLFSLIRFIRDTQKLINIYESAIAEKIGLSNRVPYLGYAGQFTDPKWQDCNVKNYAYLETALVKGPSGEPLPLPQRQELEEQISALSQALAQEIQNLKSGMGIYDQSLGEGHSEQSGVGIGKRQQQSNIINFHFSDNLMRAQWDLNLKLLQIIPKIYDRPGRQVRIVGEDQVHSVVIVNQQYRDDKTGAMKHYPLDVGEYDVVITVGPSYTTARQEAADTLQQFFTAAPQTVALLADLWVGNLDYPWSREAARRLKAAAPQEIVTPPEDKGQANIPPAFVQQMQKLTEDAAQAHAFAQSLHEQLATKQPELDTKIAMQKAELDFKREQLAVTAAIGEAQAKNTAAIALLNSEIDTIKHERGLMADAAAQKDQQAHEISQTQAAQAHEVSQTREAQAHQAALATQSQTAASDAQSQQIAADQQQQEQQPEAA